MSCLHIVAEDCFGFRKRPLRSEESIARMRDERLRRVVAHAARNVPYYRRLFAEAGLNPRDIRSVEDLRRIPASSKESLQGLPLEERLSQGIDPSGLVRHSTSGSTGMPMIVLRTRLEEALVHAYQLRSQLVFGVPLRTRRAKIGKTYDPRLLHRLGVLPMTAIDPVGQLPGEVLETARRWRAECLDVRPGVLEPMVQAAELDARGDWPWRWIVCGGEVLYPDLLKRSEQVFGARILERYGAHEVGQIAWRCLDCGFMHTNDDSVVLEVLRSDGRPAQPGEAGEVLATGLLSFAMPFLRFRLADLAEQGPAPHENRCRFGFSRIRSVQGRQIDNLTLEDGRSVPTYGLMASIRQAGDVLRFQIIQEGFERVRIVYVPKPERKHDLGAELERRLQEALPVFMSVSAEAVAEILPDGSGKYRYVRSFSPGSPSSSRTRQ